VENLPQTAMLIAYGAPVGSEVSLGQDECNGENAYVGVTRRSIAEVCASRCEF
jgi:hypothetical protein